MVYQLLGWRGRTEIVQVALWLLGYEVNVERCIRPRLIQILERVDDLPDESFLARHGVREDHVATGDPNGRTEEEAEEVRLDRLSMLAVRNSKRWRHVPRKDPHRRIISDPRVIEAYLNVLLNPRYAPSAEALDELAEIVPLDNIDRGEIQQVLSLVAQHFSLPRQRDAAALAPVADWRQAQQDYQHVLKVIVRFTEQQGEDMRECGKLVGYTLVLKLGIHFILVDLALRRAGCANWIAAGLRFTDAVKHYLDTGSWEWPFSSISDAQE
jgi:hypothetical protein